MEPHLILVDACRLVKERFGYKSYDAQFMLQYLLQFDVVNTSKPEAAVALMRLGDFFRGLCGKMIELEDIPKLQEQIIKILSQL